MQTQRPKAPSVKTSTWVLAPAMQPNFCKALTHHTHHRHTSAALPSHHQSLRKRPHAGVHMVNRPASNTRVPIRIKAT